MQYNSAAVFYRQLRRKVLVERSRLDDGEIDRLLAAMNALADGPRMFDRADVVALERGWWRDPGRFAS